MARPNRFSPKKRRRNMASSLQASSRTGLESLSSGRYPGFVELTKDRTTIGRKLKHEKLSDVEIDNIAMSTNHCEVYSSVQTKFVSHISFRFSKLIEVSGLETSGTLVCQCACLCVSSVCLCAQTHFIPLVQMVLLLVALVCACRRIQFNDWSTKCRFRS